VCCPGSPGYGIYYRNLIFTRSFEAPIRSSNDLSDLSRRIRRDAGCERALSVAVRARTLAEAHAAIDRGRLCAVEIPPGTERDVLKGNTLTSRLRGCHLPFHIQVDPQAASPPPVGALTSDSFARRALGRQPRQGEIGRFEPGRRSAATDLQPGGRLCELHRPGGFVLILQQTLLIGGAMLTGHGVATGGGAFGACSAAAIAI